MAIMLIKISARMVFVSFIGLHLSSGTSSLWTIPDLFSDNSLQFIVSLIASFFTTRFPNPYFDSCRSSYPIAKTISHIPPLKRHPRNPINYLDYHTHYGSSKLILFGYNKPQLVLTPCIVSSLMPPRVSIINKDFSLSKLAAVWNSLNGNLLMRPVGVRPFNEGLECSVTLSNFKKATTPEQCRILYLSRIHNFSISEHKEIDNAISFFHLNTIPNDLNFYVYVRGGMDVFKLVYRPVKFSIVTHQRSEFQGMYAFLLPFAAPVWVILFFFCIMVTVLIQLSKNKTAGLAMIDDFVMVSAILFSQTNGDSLKLFRGRNTVAKPVLTEPVVPTSLAELVDSNLPIITTTSYSYNRGVRRRQSVLKTSLIPSVTLLTSIMKSQPMTNAKISFPVDGTFSIMDYSEDLNLMTELIKIYEGRLVINGNRDNTPFSYITFDIRYNDFLSPIFHRTLTHLEAMGVEEKWKKLQTRKMTAMQLYYTKTPRYRWYFSRREEKSMTFLTRKLHRFPLNLCKLYLFYA
ncbi:hypothetical protein Fcan01_16294 [Folsomia candida]|uniref:Uncharacterized protein n=1 Tax=Folsomia candida TaxID=158441 RepID=A0A226DW84_FOLCA|nr:hypothetical protein Fcan01_16294 [Folsomia candida]